MQDLLADIDSLVDSSSTVRSRHSLSATSEASHDYPDRFGFWDHREDLLSRDALLFDPDLDLSAPADDERVSLPPFLLRSLRARRQATFGERGSGIASEADNYLDDFELDSSYEGLLALSERIGEAKGRGATEAALRAGLTRYAFVAPVSPAADPEGAEARCGICLEDYTIGDECATSKTCGHGMHSACLEVRSHSASCRAQLTGLYKDMAQAQSHLPDLPTGCCLTETQY